MKKLTLIDRSIHMQPAVDRLVGAFHQLGYVISPGDIERAYSDWSEDNYAASWYMLPEKEEHLLELCKRLLEDGIFQVSEEGPGDTVCQHVPGSRDMSKGELLDVAKLVGMIVLVLALVIGGGLAEWWWNQEMRRQAVRDVLQERAEKP